MVDRRYLLKLGWGALALASLAPVACSGGDDAEPAVDAGVSASIVVTSTAFSEGAAIPIKYSCDGDDVSPPLSWTGVPEGTRSLALISDDPDARGTWVHWVLYGITADVDGLSEAVVTADVTAMGAKNGTNDFKRLGYGGPCPPKGSPHRYFFKVYALDVELDLDSGAKKKELLEAMEGHVLARGQLMGTYQRQ
ncbi:MAG: YbhB/YbcL family Raf kinase inhibitor-like protein [Chloroflexi bacterium]|nr:YbhB/YbcL family Raf kinase inhibitor-like protein [Chloroflexota bacterium]